MTRHHRKKSRAKLLRSLYIWHRYIGISTAVFVIVLAVTGLFLNHTEELGLDATHVQSDLLLDWYGIHAPAGLVSFKAGKTSLTTVGDQVYLDDDLLPLSAPLAGTVMYGDLLVVAAGGVLGLFTASGELVEKMDRVAGVPAGIQAIGITPQPLLAVRTADGVYLANSELLEWYRMEGSADVQWSSATPTAPDQEARLQAAYRGTGLPLERILLDLHSGRILGQAGVYLMDAAAIGFLLLAGSGIWLWMRRRASVKAHQRKKKRHAGDPVREAGS